MGTTGPAGVSNRLREWKLVSSVTGAVVGLLVQRLMRAAYRKVRKQGDPEALFDTTDTRFSWPDAIAWGAAAGVGLGIAKVVSNRIAAIGWEAATGAPPPVGTEEAAS